MADNSFGIKELNLVGSGTPKIESLTNLNLEAVTVAISTNATVGGNLDVDGHTELDDVNISGVSTFAGITTVTGQTLFTKQLGVSGFSTFFNDVKFAGANYDALWDNSEDRLEFKDGAAAVFGTGNDLEIKHSGGNTTLKNITGQLRIAGNDLRLQNQTSSADFIKVNATGSVVTGILTATNVSASSSITATTFYGSGANLTGVTGTTINNNADNRVITGSGTANTLEAESSLTYDGTTLTATSYRSNTTTGDGSDIAFAIKYYITSSGSSAYRFAGAGVLNSSNNPTLYFQRGFTYILENSTGGSHPFELRVTSGGSAYAPGGQFLTGSTTGTQILTVPMDAPASIVYQCTIHGGMVGTINFVQ
tara:strand:- start:1650 stop:2744 length:1095 start_codon:yes stop_codon:yes gene_type:complete